LLGVRAIGGGHLLEPRFNVRREMYFHALQGTRKPVSRQGGSVLIPARANGDAGLLGTQRKSGGSGIQWTMLLRPTSVLIATTCVVGLSILLAPFVTGAHAYGASAWATIIFAQVVAAVVNSVLFIIPGGAIWLALRKRRPTLCSVAIIAWCVSYFGLMWVLFLKACCE
jgi:hypothetical protein